MKILVDKKFIDYNAIFSNEGKISFEKGSKINFPNNVKYIVPGFIDQHIHGAVGKDAMDNSSEAVEEISKGILAEGTTSFLATTMTYDSNVLVEVLDKISTAMNSKVGANILGVHLEGPFISEDFIGTQNPKYVSNPNVKLFEEINKNKIVFNQNV